MKNYSSHIGIVGGGIAGLAVGCALRLQGIDTIVFERADKVSEYGAGTVSYTHLTLPTILLV